MTLRLFVWTSKYLANYANGTLIAVAPNAETARDVLRGQFDSIDRARHAWRYFDSQDEDDLADLEQDRLQFEADIAPEPRLVEENCLFISGSE